MRMRPVLYLCWQRGGELWEKYEPDPMAKRETLQLVRAYYKISDPQIRKRLYEMTKAIAADV